MAGTRRFAVAGLVLALLVAGVVSASAARKPAKSAELEQITFTFNKLTTGKLRGLIVARQKGSNAGIRVYISLHRLEPSTRYVVAASDKPCSQRVDASDYLIWRRAFTTPRGVQDVFVTEIVRRRGQLSRTRSVRAYLDDTDVVQCAKGTEVSIESIE